MVCLIVSSLSVLAQEDETAFYSADGHFVLDDVSAYPFAENFDPTNDWHQTLVASYQFDIAVDRSIIDEATTIVLSTHDSDEIEDGQIIISVVTNENWQPFDITDGMLNHWYDTETADQFEAVQYDEREGAELDISGDDGTGLYSVVMMGDGLYALTIAISPDPTVNVDTMRAMVAELQASISYEPAEIITLDDLKQVTVDDTILASDIPSPSGVYSFRAPQAWRVSINRNGTVTLASAEIADNDLPEYALEFDVRPLSPYVRQPEAYITEVAETLGAPLASDFADPAFEANVNGRRVATFDDYADFTGLTLVMLLDGEHVLVMNGISSIGDADTLAQVAYAVADSVQIVE